MKKCYVIVSISVVLLGIVHVLCTTFFYHSFSLDALWFAGTGMGVSAIGLLNFSAIKADSSQLYIITILSNIVCSILLVMITSVIGFEIQAIAGIVLIMSTLVLSIHSWRTVKRFS